MASNTKVTYTLNLNSNVSQILQQNEKDALRLDGTMWQLQKTLSSFGIGLGATFIADAAKEWIKGAADFEQAMIRIKNASQEGFSIFNQDFLMKQVDRFKIGMQEAADSYSNFLFNIKNANITNDVKNRIFEDLTIVGKVAGLEQSKLDQITYELGVQLGAGVLESRQLRPLLNLHPNLAPFIADELGLKDFKETNRSKQLHIKGIEKSTAVEQLFQSISNMHLTKSAIPSIEILVPALDKYTQSLTGKLPEALKTVNSELNQLGNTWLKFKNDLVLGQKPELIEFFHSLESGIKWLSEHEEEILKIGRGLVNIIKLYAEWRLALFALQIPLQIPMGIAGFFAGEQARLNSVLGVSKKNIVLDNIKLEESELKLNEIEEVGIAKTNQVISSSVKESEAIREKTVSLDLFTEAQIANIAATEKLRDEWVQAAATAQASLFSKAEMDLAASYGVLNPQIQYQTEMMEANAIAAQQMAAAQEANAAAIALQADVLGASNYGNAMANIATMPYAAKNAISKIPGLISSAVMPVFIAGMALEVASQFLPKGAFNNEEVELMDHLSVLGTAISSIATYGIYTWTEDDSGGGVEKLERIAHQNSVRDAGRSALFQEKYFSGDMSPLGIYHGLSNFMKGYGTQKLSPEGHELFNLFSSIDKNIPYAHILSQLKDKYGNIEEKNKENENLVSLAEKLFGKDYVPYIQHMITNQSEGTGTPKFNAADANLSHIRGNSSNYVTINIHEMNGIKSYQAKYDKNGTKIEEEKLSEIVGVTLVKILTGVVNDSQLVGRHH